ncbi:MAG TPA: aminoglycoside phosphotransferase family protein [Acidimicrobiia bacterium]
MLAPTGIGIGEARGFLIDHLGHDVGPVELVGEGAWSRCFGFRDGDRDLVIRFGNHVGDFEKDRRAGRFAAPLLPVPQVSEIGPAFGGYFAISTRASGEPLECLGPREWEAVLPALFAALDAIRSIDVADTAGFGGWDAHGAARCATWRDFLLSVDVDNEARRTYGWRRRLADSPVGDAPFVAGMARISELADACPDVRSVVHADLINRNVLVDGDRITAVFDWGCSFYGDFLYDLAWLEFWAPWHPSIAATDVRGEARRHYASIGLDVPDLDVRLRCYLIHIGLDHQAYCAFTGQLDELATITERTLGYVESG